MALEVVSEFAVHGTSTAEGQDIVFTFFYRTVKVGPVDITFDDMVTVCNDLTNWVVPTILPVLSDTYKFLQATLRTVKPVLFEQIVSSVGAGALGSRTGPPAAMNLAACISRRSNLPGRSYRGRVYLGPVSEDDTDKSYFTPGYHASLVNCGTQLLGSVATGVDKTSSPVVYSKALNIDVPYLRSIADQRVCSQRKRLPRLS